MRVPQIHICRHAYLCACLHTCEEQKLAIETANDVFTSSLSAAQAVRWQGIACGGLQGRIH